MINWLEEYIFHSFVHLHSNKQYTIAYGEAS